MSALNGGEGIVDVSIATENSQHKPPRPRRIAWRRAWARALRLLLLSAAGAYSWACAQ